MSTANYCVRLWFANGNMFDRVFDDYEEARLFSNNMMMRADVEDAHLWEL